MQFQKLHKQKEDDIKKETTTRTAYDAYRIGILTCKWKHGTSEWTHEVGM